MAGPWGQGTRGVRLVLRTLARAFHTQSQHGGGAWEAPSVPRGTPCKRGGAQDRKSLQKVGVVSDITLYKHLGTNSRGRKWIPCLSTAYSQEGRQIMNRWADRKGLLEQVMSGLGIDQ